LFFKHGFTIIVIFNFRRCAIPSTGLITFSLPDLFRNKSTKKSLPALNL
jgi:hypothetical protein